MLDAVASQHLDMAVIHFDREMHDQLVLGFSHDLANIAIEIVDSLGLFKLFEYGLI